MPPNRDSTIDLLRSTERQAVKLASAIVTRTPSTALEVSALRDEQLAYARSIVLIRLIGVSSFFLLFVALGQVLGLRSWQGNLTFFAPYWVLTVALSVASFRSREVLRYAGVALAVLDAPMIFGLQYATFDTTPNPAAVAGYTMGVYVLLVLLAAQTLVRWQVILAAVTTSVCEMTLQRSAGVELGAMLSTPVLLGLAASASSFGILRVGRLLRRVTTFYADRQRAEAAFRILVEGAPDAIALIRAGKVEYANPAFRRLTGHDEAAQLVGVRADELVEGESGFGAGALQERRFKKQGGGAALAEVSVLEIADERGSAELLVARDVTDLRQAQALRQRSERLAAIGQLAAGIGHDLRSPLSAIRLASDGLKNGTSPAVAAKMVDVIGREVGVATRILNDLMDFARDQQAQVSAEKLEPLIREVCDLVQKPSNVRVLCEVPSELVVKLDRDRFRRALVNLAQNGAEAVPSNAPGEVMIRAKTDGADVIISVHDNGMGISKEQQARLFEPLFTTKKKGTGLGLAAVASIVAQHKGSVTVTSEEGKGTRFDIRIPLS